MATQLREYNYTRKVILKDGTISVQKNTVHKYVKNPHKPKEPLTDEQIGEINELFKLGVTKKNICKKFNITYYDLCKLLGEKPIDNPTETSKGVADANDIAEVDA